MKKGYMIQDYKNGFWSEKKNGFKGVAFAKLYDSIEEAEEKLEEVMKIKELDYTHGNTPMFIVSAYLKSDS